MLDFLAELGAHNDRAWFERNRERHVQAVREPARAFIRAMAPRLEKISPELRADDRTLGGSLMRIHRDVRFSPDKRPYKTNVGIQFRHRLGRDVHAPGLYVHLEPGRAFLGAGMWRPESGALAAVRALVDEAPERWQEATGAPGFARAFTLEGERLRSAPRGYPRDHPLIDDLRRKDFIAIRPFPPERALEPDFAAFCARELGRARPFMAFLCEALDIAF